MPSSNIASLAGALLAGAGLLQKSSGPTPALYSRCARICATNAKTCQACNKHCQSMQKMGMKGHEKSLALSADCRDICETAGKVLARRGPLSEAICETCLKSCEACQAECIKYPNMGPMAACAASCKECIAVCKEFLQASASQKT